MTMDHIASDQQSSNIILGGIDLTAHIPLASESFGTTMLYFRARSMQVYLMQVSLMQVYLRQESLTLAAYVCRRFRMWTNSP